MSPILQCPINREIIEFLSRRVSREGSGIDTPRPLSYVPPEDPGFGIHPDAVQHVWSVLPSLLPIDCRLEVLGFPALVHPSLGVLFGVAFGFNYVCLRLPITVSNEYCHGERPSGTFADWQKQEFRGLPNDWIVLRWGFRDRERCLAAYRLTGGLAIRIQMIRAGWWIWSTSSFRVVVDADDCNLQFAVEEVGRDIVSAVQPRAAKVTSVTVVVHSWRNSGALEIFQDRLKNFVSARVFIPLLFD